LLKQSSLLGSALALSFGAFEGSGGKVWIEQTLAAENLFDGEYLNLGEVAVLKGGSK
jgi:hypothetical protein